MKRVVFLLITFLVLGCSSDDSNDTQTPASTGTAPTIDKVQLVRLNSQNEYEPVNFFYIGDLANFAVYYTDPEEDLATIEIAQYHPTNSPTPYYGPDVFGIADPRPGEALTGFVYLAQDTEITGPVGRWKGTFKLTDRQGNQSEEYAILTAVLE